MIRAVGWMLTLIAALLWGAAVGHFMPTNPSDAAFLVGLMLSILGGSVIGLGGVAITEDVHYERQRRR